jgi:tetratricopeptide (TPR) repeat protein
VVIAVGLLVAARGARAEPPSAAVVKDAGTHFDRGVALYTDSDFRGALVEFRRAYDTAPNAAVLYNIGETYYQLQNYAAALTTLERYLIDAGAAAAHRREVEQTIAILKARVGALAITTNVDDCEIAIDDAPAGRTPLAAPIVVSVGSRKLTVSHAGRPSETRQVDVAAGDVVAIAVSLAEPVAPAPVSPPVRTAPASIATRAPSDGDRALVSAWVTTGGLAAIAIGTGAVAIVSAHQLHELRDEFPVTQQKLDDKASRVRVFSAIADVSGVLAVVAGGLSLTLQLTHARDHEAHVAVGPGGLIVAGAWR